MNYGRDFLGPIQALTRILAQAFHRAPEFLDRVYFSQSSKEFLLIRRLRRHRTCIEISSERLLLSVMVPLGSSLAARLLDESVAIVCLKQQVIGADNDWEN